MKVLCRKEDRITVFANQQTLVAHIEPCSFVLTVRRTQI